MKRVRAEVLSTRKLGAFHQLTIVAPEIAEEGAAGQFVAVRMPVGREFLLRRHLAIHDASRRGGWAGTLEFVIDPAGPGTPWLASARAHSFLDLIARSARIRPSATSTNCLLVAERHGAAAVLPRPGARRRGKRVDMVVGAETMAQVLKPIEAKRLSQTVAIVTADGTLGDRGAVMDALPEAADRSGAQVVYAAGSARTGWSVSPRSAASGDSPRRWHRGADGVRHRSVSDVRGADRAQGRPAMTTSDRASMGPSSIPRVLWDRWLGEQPTMLPTPPEGAPRHPVLARMTTIG